MTEPNAIPETKDLDARQALLDQQMKRFEERVQAEDDLENRNRPRRDRVQTIEAAIVVVEKQLKVERGRLDQSFRMAAQEQAQKETVRELEWLVEDLRRIRAEGA